MQVCKYTLDTFCLIPQYNLFFFFTPIILAHFVPKDNIILTYVSSGPLKIQEFIYLCKILDS